jgi:hypothetical protein
MRFQRELFSFDGMSLYYGNKFVARFKYMKSNMSGFRSFLMKNFDFDEYFGRLADHCGGNGKESPLEILESKGFVLNHIKKWLKRDGFQTDAEGYRLWREYQRQKIAQSR